MEATRTNRNEIAQLNSRQVRRILNHQLTAHRNIFSFSARRCFVTRDSDFWNGTGTRERKGVFCI